jgi:predicted amidohydrolase YtcJ
MPSFSHFATQAATRVIIVLVLLTAFACSNDQGSPETGPDLIFFNGTVYTVDEQRSSAEAVAVSNGLITFVGDEAEARSMASEGTRLIDMNGGMLLPGFTDAHVHTQSGGNTLNNLALYDAETPEELVEQIRLYATSHPELEAITGSGWQLSVFPGGTPHKALLDAVESERPVILESADGHNAWVNSKALELAGIDQNTADPENGRIDRDAETGEAIGTLRESAIALVSGLLPTPTLDSVVDDLKIGQIYQNSHGFTAAIEASVKPGIEEEAFMKVALEGELTLRTQLSFLPGSDYTDSQFDLNQMDDRIEKLIVRRDQVSSIASPYLSAPWVKIFVDGVLENQTGALLEPYINSPQGPDDKGKLNIPEDSLKSYVIQLDAAGFDVHMHAIGDGAIRAGLDSAAAAIDANGPQDRRITIAHLELIDPADIARFAPLGVYANMQTLWAAADTYITELTEPFLGPERSLWLYPNRSLRDAGAILVSGSDWPVSTSNPFQQMEVAVARQFPDDTTAEPWHPEQALTVEDMLVALTINGAKIMRQDGFRGSIETGKVADLVLISRNALQTPPRDLGDISIWLTFLDGREIFRSESFESTKEIN